MLMAGLFGFASPAMAQMVCSPVAGTACGASGGAASTGHAAPGGQGNGQGGAAIDLQNGGALLPGMPASNGTGGDGASGVNADGSPGGAGGAGGSPPTLVTVTTVGGRGGDGGSGTAPGGGGGGGVAVYVAAGMASGGVTFVGGAGGNGGAPDMGGGGSGGGGGGAGILLGPSDGVQAAIANGASTGGEGGNGGEAVIPDATWGGGGGGGGDGVLALGTNAVIGIDAATSITGGTGGVGGAGSSGNGIDGNSGSGIRAMGTGLSVTNNGTIQGGEGRGSGAGGVGIITQGGASIVNNGVLAGGLDTNGRASSVLFNGLGSTLTLQSGSSLTGAVELAAGASATITPTATSTIDGAKLDGGGAQLTLNLSSASLDIQSSVTGAGDLIKTGASTLALSGASSFAGALDIEAGTVAMGAAGSLSQSIAVKLANPGAGFDMSAADQTIGSLTGVAGTTLSLGSKTLTVGGLNLNTGYGGTIGGSGKLVKSGTGILTLSGANTYGGGTRIEAGTIKLAGGGGIGTGGLDTTNAGTFDLGGLSRTLSALNGLAGSFITNSAAGTGRLTVDGSGDFSGIIQDGTGPLTLTKAGAGTLTLNGVNTYTGLTTVSGGTLIVGGDGHSSAAIAGNVSVGNGATLGGHGTVGSTVINSGGKLAPGASIGTLTVNGDLTLAQGSILAYEFGAPGANFSTPGISDSLHVTGDLTMNGTTLAVTDSGGFGPGLYMLADYGGSLTMSNGGIVPPVGYTIQILAANKQINLVNSTGLVLNFWNANGLASASQMGGGDGTWSNTSPVWTNEGGTVTGAMQPQPGFAIFGGAAGTVTVDDSNGDVAATGMQFASDGYRLTGDALTLVADADHPAPVEIRVGDGSAGSSAWTAVIDNAIDGGAGLKKTGAGTLVLNGANLYSGGTTLEAGVLSVSSEANLGDAAGGLIFNGGTLRVTGTAYTGTTRATTLTGDGVIDVDDAGNRFALDQVIDGAGGLTKQGAGTLVLGKANTYTGASTLTDGTLALAGTGSIATSSSLTIDGGAFDLTGLAGDTSVNNLSGAGGALKLGAGTLTVDQSVDGSFAGTLSGVGGLTKSGAGKLTYDGDGSAFAGMTTVAGGTLVVGSTAGSSAKLGGSLEADGTATLAGHGRIGSGAGSVVTIASGATISPGSSIGTLTIDGEYVQQAGSTYLAEIAPDGTSDLVSVTGTATIEGGTVYASKTSGSYTPGTIYTILTATDGVSGQYDALDQNTPFVDLKLTYDPTSVHIRAVRNNVNFCAVATTGNECAVADAVESLGDGNVLFDAVAGVPSAEVARAAFDQLSGGLHASARSVLITNSQLIGDIIDARLRAAFGAVAAESAPVMAYGEQGKDSRATAAIDGALAPADTLAPAAWGTAFGDWGHLDGGISSTTGGFLTGIDAAFGSGWRAGITAGYSHTSFDTDMASGDSQNWHLGLYGGGQWGALGLRAGAAYTWHDISTARSVDFPGFSDHLSADYDAGTAQAFGELAYGMKAGTVGLEPFANLAYINLHTDGFAEKGGAAALTSPSSNTDATFTTLGLRASTEIGLGSMTATARGTLGWRHAFEDETRSVFAFAGSDPFTITAPIARDAALIEAGLDLALSPNATLGLAYRGQLASSASQNGFDASFHLKF